MSDILLDAQNLIISFKTGLGIAQAVRDVSFSIKRGESLAILGESGSGKSVTALSVAGILPSQNSCRFSGKVIFDGKDIFSIPKKELEELVGRKIGIVFQNPSSSIHPTIKIGEQISEVIVSNLKISKKDAKIRAVELLNKVGISEPDKKFDYYLHQFSGGMRQRIAIAIAIACDPVLIIADEPTTALDVTIQSQVLYLLKKLQIELNVGVLIITHDLGVVSAFADRVLVMYAGKIVEESDVYNIFKTPRHPYTKGLLRSYPDTVVDGFLSVIEGSPVDLHSVPKGCSFHTRCNFAMNLCAITDPCNLSLSDGTKCCCHLYREEAKDMLDAFNRS